MSKAIAFLVLLLISPAAYAATIHIVGGNNNWTTGFNYSNWASEQNFAVGDTLLFNYNNITHAVYEVHEDYYIYCEGDDDFSAGDDNDNFSDSDSDDDDDDDDSNDDDVISAHTSSPTSILLSTTGTRYFICPVSDHCARGMKLAVTVKAGSTSTSGDAPPPSTAPSPTPTDPPPSEDGVSKLLKAFESSTNLHVRLSYLMQQFYQLTMVESFGLIISFDEVYHALYEVSQGHYNGCIDESPINVYTSSPASILLSNVGKRYFIDPRPNNCKLGLKLAVTVEYRSGELVVTVEDSSTTAGGAVPPSSGSNAAAPSPTS